MMDADEVDKRVAQNAARRKNASTPMDDGETPRASTHTTPRIPPTADPVAEPHPTIESDTENESAGGESMVDIADDIPELNEHTYVSDDDMGVAEDRETTSPAAARAPMAEEREADEAVEPTEPSGKKQRLESVTVNLEATAPSDKEIEQLKNEIKQYTLALRDACKAESVQKIIKELEKDPKLTIDPRRRNKVDRKPKSMGQSTYDLAEAYSPENNENGTPRRAP